MHGIWDIPEVTEQIVAQIDHKGDCSRMARVHKQLWHPSARQIWKTLPTFNIFFRLIPMDALEVVEEGPSPVSVVFTFDVHGLLLICTSIQSAEPEGSQDASEGANKVKVPQVSSRSLATQDSNRLPKRSRASAGVSSPRTENVSNSTLPSYDT